MKSRRPCTVEGCSLPKEPPRHRCTWHSIRSEPIERQVSAAQLRLASTPVGQRLARVPAELWPPGFRFCSGCCSMVPTFYTSGSRCYACASASAHGAMIERTYDLTAEEYGALLELQDGKCAVCRQKPVSVRLAVDHDHQTNAVRGLLCSRCNHDLLGAGHDNADMLRAAVNYLDTPPMSGDWKPLEPKKASKKATVDRAETDPSYLMFDHEEEARSLPSVLEQVAKRMTVDQLVFSGGKSDPETGTYWLAYRPVAEEASPF